MTISKVGSDAVAQSAGTGSCNPSRKRLRKRHLGGGARDF